MELSRGFLILGRRLIERYRLLKNLAQDRDALRRRLDEELLAKREAELQQNWRVEHEERTAQLKERLRQCKEDLNQGKSKLEHLQCDLDAQTSFLSAASAQLATKRLELLSHYYPNLIRAQSLNHISVASELHQKRRQVFRQLCKILPLRRTSPTVEEREKWPGFPTMQQNAVRICGAPLPLGDDPFSTPPTELAASLGYVVQLVNLAARYLSGPLLHSSGFAASSSRVWQRASYFDSRPASRSEEYPLFLPRQGGWPSAGDEASDAVGSMPSIVNYEGASSATRESHPELQKGIKLLRRSVGCICAYGFGLLSLSAPSDMPIFDALSELLTVLSMKESRTRSSRGNQQPNGRFGLSEGPLAHMAHMGRYLPSLLDERRFLPDTLGWKASHRGKVQSWNDFYENSTDSELMEGMAPNLSESTVDGWNLVEHPRLPPPPSHSEDVEHWTRAMFIDAKK